METREIATTLSQPVRNTAQVDSELDLGAFVDVHYERLLRLARLVSRDVGDAADAVQIALEQAWKNRATLRDPERLRPWLDRIVVREAIRIDRRHRGLLGFFQPIRAIEMAEPADARAELMPNWSALRTAFARLSAEQRAVIALHLHAGYSVAETASIVGAPEGTVRSRLRLAKERLRRDLEETR
jgi:RNA polymerase sigma-70 factor (ECF subfamily)